MFFVKIYFIFDYIKLCKFGETLLEVDGLIPHYMLNSYEINYIVSGMGSITSGKKVMPVAPGDMYIASKGVSHNIKSNSNSRLRFIYFTFDFLNNAPDELKDFYEIWHLDVCLSVGAKRRHLYMTSTRL